MVAEFNEKECLFLTDLIERYQNAIYKSLRSMKQNEDVKLYMGKMGVQIMEESEARKLYRFCQPLFITFFKGARGY